MGKRGPKGKGPRKEVRALVPEPLAAAVEEAAAASPYRFQNDFVTALIADAIGRPEFKPTAQEELPLKTA